MQSQSSIGSLGSSGMTINSEDGANIQLEFRDLVKNNKFTVNIKMWEEFKNDLTKNSAPFVQETAAWILNYFWMVCFQNLNGV